MFSISRNCAHGLQKKDYSILWSILESPEPEITSPILENQKATKMESYMVTITF